MQLSMFRIARNLDRRRAGIGVFVLLLAAVVISQGLGTPGVTHGDLLPAHDGPGSGGPGWEATIASDGDVAAARNAHLQREGVAPAAILGELTASASNPTAASDTPAGTTSGATGPGSEEVSDETIADEVTHDLPAGYVPGVAPTADLAATLRRSQERFNRTQLPAATNAAAALATNSRITFTRQSQVSDLTSGAMDPRVVDILTWIVGRRSSITITSMRSDHNTCVAGSNPCRRSAHTVGRAVDIAAVDGEACTGTQTGKCGILYQEIVNSLRGTQFQPSQIIYGFDLWPGESWNFELGDHHNHIHIGY